MAQRNVSLRNSSIRKYIYIYILSIVQGVEVQGFSRDVMHVLPLRFRNKIND